MNQLDLMKIDVSKFVEEKNGLSYLSWAHAWAEALKADPAATFHVESFQASDGTTIPYMAIGETAMVWVRVVMFGKEIACFLPVMNHRNQPISRPDSFQINTALMRCLTKALAFHGLGLNVYAGEDMPMVEDVKKEKEPEAPKKTKTDPSKAEQTKVAPKESKKIDYSNLADAELLVEAMIDWANQCKSRSALLDFWIQNETSLDSLKEHHLELFTKVRSVFADMKTKLSEEEKK